MASVSLANHGLAVVFVQRADLKPSHLSVPVFRFKPAQIIIRQSSGFPHGISTGPTDTNVAELVVAQNRYSAWRKLPYSRGPS